MQILIHKSEIKGSAVAPSSKSYTLRGLMCASLAAGTSELRHPLGSDDTEAALKVLRQIGVRIEQNPDSWTVQGDNFQSPSNDLFCRESAVTIRFMTAICSLIPGKCRLTAGPSLSKRPVGDLVKALRRWGVDVVSEGGFAPLVVNGGHLDGGLTELPGDVSSQYVSALLLISPLAEKNAAIRLTTTLESRPYVLMTIECLKQFGIQIGYSEDLTEYKVSPQSYRPASYKVEGDWSSASYLLGLGAVAGDMKVGNLNPNSLQGDKAIADFLKQMGAGIEKNGESIIARKNQLKAIKADLSDCTDLLPTVAVLAALASGTSEFTGVQRARLKESNRVKSVKEGLSRAGISVIEEQDKLIITGGNPHEAVIDSQNDHRIAMAFSLIGAATGGITIQGAECVSKTYPEYWDTLRSLGVKLDER